jgi:hypothetical protein
MDYRFHDITLKQFQIPEQSVPTLMNLPSYKCKDILSRAAAVMSRKGVPTLTLQGHKLVPWSSWVEYHECLRTSNKDIQAEAPDTSIGYNESGRMCMCQYPSVLESVYGTLSGTLVRLYHPVKA